MMSRPLPCSKDVEELMFSPPSLVTAMAVRPVRGHGCGRRCRRRRLPGRCRRIVPNIGAAYCTSLACPALGCNLQCGAAASTTTAERMVDEGVIRPIFFRAGSGAGCAGVSHRCSITPIRSGRWPPLGERLAEHAATSQCAISTNGTNGWSAMTETVRACPLQDVGIDAQQHGG